MEARIYLFHFRFNYLINWGMKWNCKRVYTWHILLTYLNNIVYKLNRSMLKTCYSFIHLPKGRISEEDTFEGSPRAILRKYLRIFGSRVDRYACFDEGEGRRRRNRFSHDARVSSRRFIQVYRRWTMDLKASLSSSTCCLFTIHSLSLSRSLSVCNRFCEASRGICSRD